MKLAKPGKQALKALPKQGIVAVILASCTFNAWSETR